MLRVTLLTGGSLLLLAGVGLCAYHWMTARQDLARHLAMLTRLAAHNAATAVAARERQSAEDLLLQFKLQPAIRSAWIQLPDGTTFARYGAEPPPFDSARLPQDGSRVEWANLFQGNPIRLGGSTLGTLHVWSDFQALHRHLLQQSAALLGGLLAIALALALVLSGRLHGMISETFLRLARLAKGNTAQTLNPGAIREAVAADGMGLFTDEVIEIFAEMRIQEAALQQAHQDLKRQVTVLEQEVVEHKQAEARLNVLHKQLLDASRQAGMAEVATGVLHNVGNVLNSVNVSVTLLQERLRRSKTANLAKVVALLRDHAGDLGSFLTSDAKGRMIPGYLDQLSVHLEQENADILQVMELVVKNMEHIKKIVAMQQNYAKTSAVKETLPAASLVEDALQIHAASLDRHGIKVVRDYADVPPITVDKHKVLQILVNLVHNAKHALDESDREEKMLRLEIAQTDDHRLLISISDNGVGIKPENLTRIFSHGFTTKKNGHGFGLHSGALAAKELQGSLKAHSDGPGCGARFTLDLPFHNGKGGA